MFDPSRRNNETLPATPTVELLLIWRWCDVSATCGMLQNRLFLCHSANEHHTFCILYAYWRDIHDSIPECNSIGNVQCHQNVSSPAVAGVDHHQPDALVCSVPSSACTVLFHKGMSSDPSSVLQWCNVVAMPPRQTHWPRSKKVVTTTSSQVQVTCPLRVPVAQIPLSLSVSNSLTFVKKLSKKKVWYW